MSASLALDPTKVTPASVLVKAQLKTKPRPSPAGTSLAGQTAVVTGSNGGLGLEASRQMLALGLSRLIMGVRDVAKGERAATALRTQFPQARVDVWALSQESFDSVRAFAARCASDTDRLDVVVLNAAFATAEWAITADGHESMFQVNYLSTALLAFLLLPVLKASATAHAGGPGRLTIVNSNLALTEPFLPTDKDPLFPWLDDTKENAKTWRLQAAQHRHVTTKILGLMLVQKLGELVDPDQVIVNAVDPGMVKGTEFQRHLPAWLQAIIWLMYTLLARTLEQGGWLYVDAVAVKGKESHGGLLFSWELHSFHPDMYTPEGRATTDRVWHETLSTLEFADVQGALASVRRAVGKGRSESSGD